MKDNIYKLTSDTYIQEDWYYKIYFDNKTHICLRRYDAFNFYRDNQGSRIDIVDKWDNTKYKTIIDKPNIDIERIRNDLTLKKSTKNQRKAIEQWNKANTKQIALKLNKNTDEDILIYLNSVSNKNGAIKQAIREFMAKQYQVIPTYQSTQNYQSVSIY